MCGSLGSLARFVFVTDETQYLIIAKGHMASVFSLLIMRTNVSFLHRNNDVRHNSFHCNTLCCLRMGFGIRYIAFPSTRLGRPPQTTQRRARKQRRTSCWEGDLLNRGCNGGRCWRRWAYPYCGRSELRWRSHGVNACRIVFIRCINPMTLLQHISDTLLVCSRCILSY